MLSLVIVLKMVKCICSVALDIRKPGKAIEQTLLIAYLLVMICLFSHRVAVFVSYSKNPVDKNT